MEQQTQEQRERPPRRKITISLIIGGIVISIVLASTVAVKVHLGSFVPEFPKPSPTAKASTTPTPLFPPSWQLVLNDALKDNGNGYNWGIGGDSKANCKFSNGGFLISVAENKGRLCSDVLPTFSNFAFEVQMQILQGDEGGIILRRNGDSGDQYAFYISQEGTCRFDVEIHNGLSKTLYFRTCPAFHTGLNVTNLVEAVANNNIFDLFVNRQFIAAVTDPDASFSSGQIGFFADSRNDPTQVLFENAKVWTPGS